MIPSRSFHPLLSLWDGHIVPSSRAEFSLNRVPLLGGRPGLGLAAVQHPDHGLLPGRPGGAIRAHGTPEILNTDQGSQFTSTFKYEEVYLPAYDSVAEAQRSLARHFTLTTRAIRIRPWTAGSPIWSTLARSLTARLHDVTRAE
jgi:hypothetical protein